MVLKDDHVCYLYDRESIPSPTEKCYKIFLYIAFSGNKITQSEMCSSLKVVLGSK